MFGAVMCRPYALAFHDAIRVPWSRALDMAAKVALVLRARVFCRNSSFFTAHRLHGYAIWRAIQLELVVYGVDMHCLCVPGCHDTPQTLRSWELHIAVNDV